jgi:hypothetical protein
MATEAGLSTITAVTAGRRRRLAERLREHGVEGVEDAIAAIGASAFCRGNGPRGWKADFDFLLQADSLARAREGKYADDQTTAQPAKFSTIDQIRRDLGVTKSFLAQPFDPEPDEVTVPSREFARIAP